MDNLKEEKEYHQLRRLGQRLHIPIPEAFWTLEVTDREGNLVKRHHQRSHSWVRNAYNLMFSELACKNPTDTTFGAGKLNVKDNGGTVRYGAGAIGGWSNYDGTTNGYRAPSGNDSKGILVGSGTNPENFEDYTLQSKISEGSGAGQLNHVQSEEHKITWDGGTKVYKNELVRFFNNNSGGSVNVNEVALFIFATIGMSDRTWMNARDKLSSTVTVPSTGQLKVTYTIQLTYPS